MRQLLSTLLLFLVGAFFVVWYFFGGTERLENRTGQPMLGDEALEVVASLEHPPGKVSVSASGRVFFNFHPSGGSPVQVAEWVDGAAVPFPDAAFQEEKEGTPHFQSVSAVRIDDRNRLWVLDRGHRGRGQPRLLAFDVETRALVHRHDFAGEVAGFPSALNDLAIAPDGERVYLAHSVPVLGDPALVIYDVGTGKARRVLEGHPSVTAEPYVIAAGGRDLSILGVASLTFGVHAIAIDDTAEWLYYGPLSGDRLYRVRLSDLDDESLAEPALASRVENYGLKTLNAALAVRSGTVFLSDVEHSAILLLEADRALRTLARDPRLRWPEGVSFGPDGSLFVTCSAFHELIGFGERVRAAAPFTIFRIAPHTLGALAGRRAGSPSSGPGMPSRR